MDTASTVKKRKQKSSANKNKQLIGCCYREFLNNLEPRIQHRLFLTFVNPSKKWGFERTAKCPSGGVELRFHCRELAEGAVQSLLDYHDYASCYFVLYAEESWFSSHHSRTPAIEQF